MTANYALNGCNPNDRLTGGRWVLGPGRVQRWVQIEPVAPEPTPVHALIACPSCHARVDETCRTKTGNVTTPHHVRLAPRLCPCGARVPKQRRLCDECRHEASLEASRAYQRRLRARKAVA